MARASDAHQPMHGRDGSAKEAFLNSSQVATASRNDLGGRDTTTAEMQRLLPLKEVIKLVSVSRATIYRYLSSGMFPQPVRIGKRRVAWRASDLSEWFDKLQTA